MLFTSCSVPCAQGGGGCVCAHPCVCVSMVLSARGRVVLSLRATHGVTLTLSSIARSSLVLYHLWLNSKAAMKSSSSESLHPKELEEINDQ